MAPSPELVARGEFLELPRPPISWTRAEARFAESLRRSDLAVILLPLCLVASAWERVVDKVRPRQVRFAVGRVVVDGHSIAVDAVRGEARHGGGGELIAVRTDGEELPLDTRPLTIAEARRLGEILDAHVRRSEPTYR